MECDDTRAELQKLRRDRRVVMIVIAVMPWLFLPAFWKQGRRISELEERVATPLSVPVVADKSVDGVLCTRDASVPEGTWRFFCRLRPPDDKDWDRLAWAGSVEVRHVGEAQGMLASPDHQE